MEHLDISDSLTWEEGLPRPQWDLLESWLDVRVPSEDWDQAWSSIGRQWLDILAPELGSEYVVAESGDCLALAPQRDGLPDWLTHLAWKSRQALVESLPGVADFPFVGKQIVIAIENKEEYYRYLSVYYPEGHHGGSAGMHIRQGYYHIVLCGSRPDILENTLAHEMTHASLCHLTLPLWVEEGLAQMFEHDITGRALLQMNEEMARRHKRYWTNNGLEEFWHGEGFAMPGKVQGLCYQLAEILVRLLIEEHRPGWFGWGKNRQTRLLAFLKEANREDCGASTAAQHLGFTLSEVAAWFLGPGEWGPGL